MHQCNNSQFINKKKEGIYKIHPFIPHLGKINNFSRNLLILIKYFCRIILPVFLWQSVYCPYPASLRYPPGLLFLQ